MLDQPMPPEQQMAYLRTIEDQATRTAFIDKFIDTGNDKAAYLVANLQAYRQYERILREYQKEFAGMIRDMILRNPWGMVNHEWLIEDRISPGFPFKLTIMYEPWDSEDLDTEEMWDEFVDLCEPVYQLLDRHPRREDLFCIQTAGNSRTGFTYIEIAIAVEVLPLVTDIVKMRYEEWRRNPPPWELRHRPEREISRRPR